ncbi:CDP-diacylglycerol diphosphatase [Acinetobacter nectaris]|uniref:CDP-diacylglycerol pyrophosphatase n=1 Tax=Acinetobacter nectaris TaxID=1219382 RepID=UPI001F02A457|nr:CDP-diacylglycerol diphosphatase [Acinetobacter nectaris]MCF9045674.1 CDP-diacylglycerol diphosphatase [Acinetobacter nectaris]
MQNKTWVGAIFGIACISLIGCQQVSKPTSKRNILWHIVSERCGTNQDVKGDCLVINKQEGYVVLRDIKGPVQTLIIPTHKVTGIEDAQLLNVKTPNYFHNAWINAQILNQQNKKEIDPKYLSFSVNSSHGRTQDQLHIHSSCLKENVYTELQKYRNDIHEQWFVLPNKLLGHTYIAKKIKISDLDEQSPFLQLGQYVKTQPKAKMGDYGLAMVSVENNEVILLATKFNVLEMNLGSIEEVQDTECQVTR